MRGLLTLALSPLLLPLSVSAQSKVPITAGVYNDLLYYAELVAAAQLQQNNTTGCKTIPHHATLYQNLTASSTDTHALIYSNSERSEYVLTFPGSFSQQNYKTDLTYDLTNYVDAGPSAHCLGGCQVHQGFQTAWVSIESKVTDALTAAINAQPSWKIKIVGGSLGGALSDLAFAYLTYQSKIKPQLNGTYTYGEPRVGNTFYASFIDTLSGATSSPPGTYHRVTHGDGKSAQLPHVCLSLLNIITDAVPKLPPNYGNLVNASSQYEHCQVEYFESAQDGNPVTLAGTYRCFGNEPSDCNYGAADANPAEGFQEHETYGGYATGSHICGMDLVVFNNAPVYP